MTRWERAISTVGGARVIVALGGLFVTLAAVWVLHLAAGDGSIVEAVLGAFLIGGPGLLIMYGGYRLPDTDLHLDTYPRVVAWCLGGFGAMLMILVLLELNPTGGSIDEPLFAVPLATAIGSLGGLAIGLNEARAFTRARVAEQRNRELQRTQADLEDALDQLKASNERLEASNERLEQFAYAASHDLQEPLRMVSSYLLLLENRYADELDEDAQDFIDFAVDGADRMRGMIESLLEYSRVTTHGDPLEPTDAEAVLEEVLDDLRLRIEETDATVTTDELPTVTADADQLAQVFQNLVSNALTYSWDEPPQVHVSAEREDDTWRFSVADEGIGIDPKYHDRIFDVFKSLHAGEEGAGSGIGLALCERIIERHHGEIWVESESGEGATFYFTLPPTEERHPAPMTQSSAHSERNRNGDE